MISPSPIRLVSHAALRQNGQLHRPEFFGRSREGQALNDKTDITELLIAAQDGSEQAAGELYAAIYDALKEVAQRQMRKERADHTLQATALVHEAYLRLMGQDRANWKNRSQFLAVAATAMRRIVVNHAVARRTQKRGGDSRQIPLDDALAAYEASAIDVVSLDAALRELATFDARQAQIVELRFFAGLGEEETARLMGVSPRTIRREWISAKAWLRGHITRNNE